MIKNSAVDFFICVPKPILDHLDLRTDVYKRQNVIMGVTVVIALAVLCTNLLLDLVYGMVDPRVRYEGI